MSPGAKSDAVGGARAWFILAVLTLVYIISFIDRQILSILAEGIKLDLKLNDAQLGFLYGTAFAIFYALFGIPLGRLADSWNRVWMVAAGLIGWSLMTTLSGFAATFAMLALARVGVGIGEASTSPAAYSLITDLFPEKRRATALSIYTSGLYIGLGLSLPAGGLLMSWWRTRFPDPGTAPLGLAPWQATFVMLGFPGLLMAALVLGIRDPDWRERRIRGVSPWRRLGEELATIVPPLTMITAARRPGELGVNLAMLAAIGVAAAAVAAVSGDVAQWVIYGTGVYAVASWVQTLRHRDVATFRLIWGTPVVVVLVVAFGAIAFITYSTGFWASPYALRTFYDGPDAPALFLSQITSLQEVSMLVGWGSALGSALGVICGGLIADRWRRGDPRGRLFTVAASLILSVPLTVAMFATSDPLLYFILVPATTFVSSAWSGAAIATINDLVLPRMRATAGATFLLGMSLVGLALGPYVAGKIGMAAGSLRIGIFSLYAAAPLILAALWYASRQLVALESTREARAGVAIPLTMPRAERNR
ncbi:hypothetical protein AWL63_16120 [Sphingomonas panacis]|uniref:Major facilitator superfamily (MFS) profile domain-containing protein n=1 Tax=Sphingomonas panacis TaxID=1560345 RepID=A0A1B3ZCW4_9SPHN|nr:MFS transporter [Sphingomonas panacis]AOH85255.1 hypothetical protein AWL63_16120 [Sphingomonas panacis]